MSDVIEIEAEVNESVGGTGGVAGYHYLPDKPSINGVKLVDDKPASAFGLVDDVQQDGESVVDGSVANLTPFSGGSTSSAVNKAGLVPKPPTIEETGQWHILTDNGWKEATPQPDSSIPWATKYSPTFSGIPKAPTAAVGTNTTQIATTAFVHDEILEVPKVYCGEEAPEDPNAMVWVDTNGDPYPMEEEIAEAVDEWVTAHPEAVTTVQDGAVSKPKLDSNLKSKIDLVDTNATHIANLDALVNNLATLQEGSTTGDAELIAARTVGSTTYQNLHTAIDTEFTNVKSDLSATEDESRKNVHFVWEHGGIDYSTGNTNNDGSLTRSRDVTYHNVKNIYSVMNGTSGLLYLIFYTDTNGTPTYSHYQAVAANTEYVLEPFDTDAYIRFDLRSGLDATSLVSGKCHYSELITDVKDVKTRSNYYKDFLDKLYPYNRIDYDAVTDNKYIRASNGNLANSNYFRATDYIDLTNQTSIVIGKGIAQFAYYKADKTYLSGEDVNTVTDVAQYTVPENAVYARFSIDKAGGNGLVYFGTVSDYIDTSDVISTAKLQRAVSTNAGNISKLTSVVPIDQIVRANVTDNKYVRASNGDLANSNLFSATDYIDLSGVTNFVLTKGIAQFAYYDADKTFLSGAEIGTITVPTEYTVPTGAVYARFSIEKGYALGGVYFMSLESFYVATKEPTFIVGENEEYTTLKSGIEEAVKWGNAKVIVKKGTYDLIEEFGSSYFENYGTSNGGLLLKNGVKVYFEQGALVTCHYTGSNQNVVNHFSPFLYQGQWTADTLLSETEGFELHNLKFEGSNTRYAIHDDASGRPIPYRNVYDHCEITFDGSAGNVYVQCIGGGLGLHGEIIIKDCVFSSTLATDDVCPTVSYHNNDYQGGNVTDESSIVVSGSAFIGSKNTLRLGYIGTSTKKSVCLAHSNLFKAEPYVTAEVPSAQNVNMELIAYANTIQV